MAGKIIDPNEGNDNKVIDPAFAAADSHLVDAEALGEKVMKSMKRSKEEEIFYYMREKLKDGYLIFAHDLDAPILEPIDDQDNWASGLVFTPMRNRKRKVEEKDFRSPE